jgi:hypothetical protein
VTSEKPYLSTHPNEDENGSTVKSDRAPRGSMRSWQPIPPFLRWSQPAGTRDHLAGEAEHLVKLVNTAKASKNASSTPHSAYR